MKAANLTKCKPESFDLNGLIHSLDTLKKFMCYSAVQDVETISFEERLKIIDIYEQMDSLLVTLRIRCYLN